MIDRPDYLNQIRPFIDTDVVKVLTGMRRSGKSTLLELVRQQLIANGIAPQSTVVRNFESARWADITSWQALYNMACDAAQDSPGRTYFFFDEVQVVPEWERAISALRVDINCDIYITGSNARLLSGELATLLSGRHVSFEVLPFSFKEYLSALSPIQPIEAFADYRVTGGMPFIARTGFSHHDKLSYLHDIVNTVVFKDIVQRKGFRDMDQLERVLTYFISEIGTSTSIKNLANIFAEERRPISRETLYNYLEAAQGAMILSRVPRFDVKGKEIIRRSEKYYVTDIGLREALVGSNAQRVDLVLENLVFLELRRRGYVATVGRIGAKEIDFVATRNGETLYVQVAYLLATEATRAREFGAYADVRDNYPKYVISMDPVDWSQNGIIHRNIVDFLLDENW